VLVPGGVHVRSDIKNWGGIYTAFFMIFLNSNSDQSISRSFDFLDPGGESVSSHKTHGVSCVF